MGGDRTKKEEMGGDRTKKEKMRGERTSTNKQDKKYQVVHKGLEEDKEDTKQCQIQYDNPLYTDFLPAISCEFWPYPLAEEWIYRKRHWPPRNVVCQIVLDGYNIVPKASPDGDKDLECRFSFSKAEGTLAQCRTNFQHRCFYIFKTIIKETAAEFSVVTTYILKTIMMWAMEQKLPTQWEGENLGKCVYGLFHDLLHAPLVSSKLPHYFIPQNNLLSHISKNTLIKEAQRISKIRSSALLVNRHESKPGLINDVMKTSFGRIGERFLGNYYGRLPTIGSEKQESDFESRQSKSAAKQGKGKGLRSLLSIFFSVTKHVIAAQSNVGKIDNNSLHELDEILKSNVKEMESYLVNHTLQGSMQAELEKFKYFMSAVAANVENPPVNDKLTETDDHEFADKIRCIIAGFETTKEQFC